MLPFTPAPINAPWATAPVAQLHIQPNVLLNLLCKLIACCISLFEQQTGLDA